MDWIKQARTDKGETVSGRMVETRSQKTSEERKELLEVEVKTDHAMNDDQEVQGLEGRGRRLASESTPVEKGHDFATSTGTLDREEMSELSDISTEIAATRRSPTDNTMMAGGTGKQTTSSSFSERMKNTFGNIFPFTMGGGAGNERESQGEEDEEEQEDTAEKIFEIWLGSGVQGHQAMMRFEKRKQREDETIDKFLDDLEMLRRRSQPDESNLRMNLAVASKFIDGVKNDELGTMLATHYTPLSINAPTPEELRLKSKEYLLLKPPSRSGYYKNNYGNFNNGPAKPREQLVQTAG